MSYYDKNSIRYAIRIDCFDQSQYFAKRQILETKVTELLVWSSQPICVLNTYGTAVISKASISYTEDFMLHASAI